MITLTQRVRTGVLAGVLASLVIPASFAVQSAEAAPRREGFRRRLSDDWVRLGSKHVDGRRDSDTINLDDRGKFRALMFRVTDSPARIKNVVVHFENGSTFKANVQETFAKGERSSVIDLPGDRRNVDRVTFHYSDLRRGDDAEVSLFGRR
jgi:hypothetical protein